MALNSLTIAAAIAALNISGVTIKDVTGIPDNVAARDCPIMYPNPRGLARGGTAEESQHGPATFGTPTTRYWVFNRVYNYVYLHAAAGSARGLYEHYGAMLTNQDAIMTALTTLDIPTVDVNGMTIGEMGRIQDPSGSEFYGYAIAVTMRERLNQ